MQRNCGRKGKKKADRSSTIRKESYHDKVINTGTIGKYVPRWGTTPMKYLKDKYD